MDARTHIVVCALLVAGLGMFSTVVAAAESVEIVSYEGEHSSAHIEPARMNDRPGLAVVFEGTDDLHFYAKSETAPAPGYNLKVRPSANGVTFAAPIFPKYKRFYDLAQQKDIEVYVGDFVIFIPFQEMPDSPFEAEVEIAGLACTSVLCLPPFTKTVSATIDPATVDSWRSVDLGAEAVPVGPSASPEQATQDANQADSNEVGPNATVAESATGRQAVLPYSTGVYYLLAVLAGISINIMPCVLPVIPLILLRLIDQSKKPGGHRLASGLAFCVGVILFFAVFALVSAIINVSTGAVLDLNSLFRYPTAVIILFLAIVFFGLAMLDVVTLALPSSVTSKQGAGSGFVGTAGMGFFAGVLSTPCSGALLGFVLVWAQTQPLLVSSIAIILMGIGMALPYAIIMSIPSLLERVPKPGTWMEIFKKSAGFLLFFIAVKLTLAALPRERLLNVLMYGILFSFCVWMWGSWVGFGTAAGKRKLIRGIALALALAGGFWLLPSPEPAGEATIDWQPYDRDVVQATVGQNQPVLLKFTADWCTNCKVVEKRIYQDPEVVEILDMKGVSPFKADTTLIDYPATTDLKEVYGEAGNVPVTIVILPDGQRRKLRGIFDKKTLIAILNELPEESKVDG